MARRRAADQCERHRDKTEQECRAVDNSRSIPGCFCGRPLTFGGMTHPCSDRSVKMATNCLSLQLLAAVEVLVCLWSTAAEGHNAPTDPFSVATWSYYATDARRIVTLPPTPVRNLQITQSYREMSRVFAELMASRSVRKQMLAKSSGRRANHPFDPVVSGNFSRQLNWPGLATWASNSAGMTIRKTEFTDLIPLLLKNLPEWAVKIIEVFPEVLEKPVERLLEVS